MCLDKNMKIVGVVFLAIGCFVAVTNGQYGDFGPSHGPPFGGPPLSPMLEPPFRGSSYIMDGGTLEPSFGGRYSPRSMDRPYSSFSFLGPRTLDSRGFDHSLRTSRQLPEISGSDRFEPRYRFGRRGRRFEDFSSRRRTDRRDFFGPSRSLSRDRFGRASRDSNLDSSFGSSTDLRRSRGFDTSRDRRRRIGSGTTGRITSIDTGRALDTGPSRSSRLSKDSRINTGRDSIVGRSGRLSSGTKRGSISNSLEKGQGSRGGRRSRSGPGRRRVPILDRSGLDASFGESGRSESRSRSRGKFGIDIGPRFDMSDSGIDSFGFSRGSGGRRSSRSGSERRRGALFDRSGFDRSFGRNSRPESRSRTRGKSGIDIGPGFDTIDRDIDSFGLSQGSGGGRRSRSDAERRRGSVSDRSELDASFGRRGPSERRSLPRERSDIVRQRSGFRSRREPGFDSGVGPDSFGMKRDGLRHRSRNLDRRDGGQHERGSRSLSGNRRARFDSSTSSNEQGPVFTDDAMSRRRRFDVSLSTQADLKGALPVSLGPDGEPIIKQDPLEKPFRSTSSRRITSGTTGTRTERRTDSTRTEVLRKSILDNLNILSPKSPSPISAFSGSHGGQNRRFNMHSRTDSISNKINGASSPTKQTNAISENVPSSISKSSFSSSTSKRGGSMFADPISNQNTLTADGSFDTLDLSQLEPGSVIRVVELSPVVEPSPSSTGQSALPRKTSDKFATDTKSDAIGQTGTSSSSLTFDALIDVSSSATSNSGQDKGTSSGVVYPAVTSNEGTGAKVDSSSSKGVEGTSIGQIELPTKTSDTLATDTTLEALGQTGSSSSNLDALLSAVSDLVHSNSGQNMGSSNGVVYPAETSNVQETVSNVDNSVSTGTGGSSLLSTGTGTHTQSLVSTGTGGPFSELTDAILGIGTGNSHTQDASTGPSQSLRLNASPDNVDNSVSSGTRGSSLVSTGTGTHTQSLVSTGTGGPFSELTDAILGVGTGNSHTQDASTGTSQSLRLNALPGNVDNSVSSGTRGSSLVSTGTGTHTQSLVSTGTGGPFSELTDAILGIGTGNSNTQGAITGTSQLLRYDALTGGELFDMPSLF